jgi:hypothetical protein
MKIKREKTRYITKSNAHGIQAPNKALLAHVDLQTPRLLASFILFFLWEG